MEKISENLRIIRKNIRLFIIFGMLGLVFSITTQYLVKKTYEAEAHLQISYPIIKNQKNDQEINNEIKILMLQAKNHIFYTEEIHKNCGVKSYEEFNGNLKVAEVRGINSVLKINFTSNNVENSKNCIKEVISRLDELIKNKADRIKENIDIKNQMIEKNINKLKNDIERDNKNSLTIQMAYLITNKNHIDSMYQEYQINNQNIYELSKNSYINQLSEIKTYLKPVYKSLPILYSITLTFSFLIAFCISILKELNIFNKQK